MVAAVRALTGKNPEAYIGDSTRPDAVRTRTLSEETTRVFRARVVNPRWIEAMRRHGYKGAFEMAATVDYLFGYDATTKVVADWMYESSGELRARQRTASSFGVQPVGAARHRRTPPGGRLPRTVGSAAPGHPRGRPSGFLETEGDLEG